MTISLDSDVLAFAATADDAATLQELERVWRERLLGMGFTYVALGAHSDPRRPAPATYVFQNYPAQWIDHFSAQRYYLIDPVFRTVESGVREFEWADPEFVRPQSWRQRRVLNEAREFGLKFGRTQALARTLYLSASASLVADTPDIAPAVLASAKLTNIVVHHRAAQLCLGTAAAIPELRRRERECLELCARGLTDEEAARSLQISPATVRRHIESARVRLGVRSRIQAVMRALRSGQINQ